MGVNVNTDNTSVTNPYLESAKAAAKQRIANADIKTYDDINNLMTSSVSLWGDKVLTEEQQKQAYTQYSQTMLDEYYDINGDGTVTVEEFAKTEELSSFKGSEIQANALGFSAGEFEKTIAQRLGNVFAQNLDFNGNGNIDAEELAFFNKKADGLDGKYDGIITNAGESAMFNEVTGMKGSNQEYNEVVNKYFMGETLTPEEQQILKEGQEKIRTDNGKKAGINVEG